MLNMLLGDRGVVTSSGSCVLPNLWIASDSLGKSPRVEVVSHVATVIEGTKPVIVLGRKVRDVKRDDAGVCVVEEDDEQDIEDDIRGQMREMRSKVEQGMVPPEAIDRWEKILRKYPLRCVL